MDSIHAHQSMNQQCPFVGYSATGVMKWTGHNDYKEMKPYIDIADDIKVSAMDKFNQIRFLCSKKSEYFDFLEHNCNFAKNQVR